MIPLDVLGPRIYIIGPSSGGKSTLAAAIGRKLDIPAIHLDRLQHQPDADWVPRPVEEFAALHAEAIKGETWVIDGDHSRGRPERLARSTGLIWIFPPRLPRLLWYFRRALFQGERAGAPDGAKDRLTGKMIGSVLVGGPRRQRTMGEIYAAYDRPKIYVRSMRELNQLYAEWGLRQ